MSRRLSRLPIETNKALAAAAVVGSRFALDLVERVVGDDLVDAFDEASKAGIVIEEPGGRYRFNHAIVRQSLLAELPSMRRMRLHQRIATTLEDEPGTDDELLAELAHHYFECAWAGNAAKAVEYCRRAADQAMARLAYEGAADLYDHALHALDEIDDELPDRDNQSADLLVARCEALLAAGDVASAAGAVSQLQLATVDSARLSAWATCFDGQLSVLVHPERLDDVEAALSAAAQKLAEIDDAAGEAKAHTVRATCLARLGRVGDCEVALDDALTAARRAREHRRVNAVLASAPLAALWGPNPVPRAGGRCLDVVRLLRITTDSPAVEATSTRCQAVLEAFRGRDAAARRMIDSARRTVTELGLRHALLEVEQFAGIVELVLDDPAAAEPHLRRAYNGFRRMGLDADTAETAALLGRACLALNRDAEADELCTESECLAGHALKPAIAWRTVRAQLLSRSGDHDEARLVAQAAVTLAERTDALVDHGDACLSLAKVLGAAGDSAGARAAAERAAELYERKGAAALADKACGIFSERAEAVVPTPPEAPVVEIHTAAARTSQRVMDAVDREAWGEFERLFAPKSHIESRRRVIGFRQTDVPSDEVMRQTWRDLEAGTIRINHLVIAVRGDRVALARVEVGTPDVSLGAPQDELLQVYRVDEKGRINLQVWFDVEDMDAALAELDAAHARFEEERPQAPRPENAAVLVIQRAYPYYAAQAWGDLTPMAADNFSIDDRRRAVNGGIRRGRDAGTKELQAAADVGFATLMLLGAVATRGERLALTRVRASGRDTAAIQLDFLNVVEIDADQMLVAIVVFDEDDFDAAVAELDARYFAGEATAHAHTWSVVAAAYAGFNRRDLLATTPAWVNIDHRRGAAFGPGDMIAYLQAAWNDSPDTKIYIGAVHRLSRIGAVVSHVARGISQEGFDAEWRDVAVLAVDGDLVSRCELFDEDDLDTAIAVFDQLSQPSSRPENTASRANARLIAHVNAREWGSAASILADDHYSDDRRRVTSSGIRRGPDADIENFRAIADLGANITVKVIATRGDRLVLTRTRAEVGENQQPFIGELLGLVETDLQGRVAAAVMYDLEDIEAAFEELDARYLAGEGAAYARTWSVITGSYAAINRHEQPATTPDWITVDHRRETAMGPGDLIAYIGAESDRRHDNKAYVETVHRLTGRGAVVTYAAHETSQEGFDAEWRGIAVFTVEGEMISRTEVYDESDLDTALARFDELSRPAPRLENVACQIGDRWLTHFAAGDWDAMAEVLADNLSNEDRRRVVSTGVFDGRDAMMANTRALAELWSRNMTRTVLATRGSNLSLARITLADGEERADAFITEFHCVIEINADKVITSMVVFDLDDFDAAVAELDARYLAGEAAPHSAAWSAVVQAFVALNRHERPLMTPDVVSVDHRRGRAFAPGDLPAFLDATWELMPQASLYIDDAHRLNDLGVVVGYVVRGTTADGFGAEWRQITVLKIAGDRVSRCEMFDEADLDAALARFNEFARPTTQLENAASRVGERYLAYFAAGDWDAMPKILADNFFNDDRRRVVGSGILVGRDAQKANERAIAELWTTAVPMTVMATRGNRLALARLGFSGRDEGPEAFLTEMLTIVEIDADERIVASVSFGIDDFDAAIAELDARYLAGEAAPYAHVWTAAAQVQAAYNRHEVASSTTDLVAVDHRRGRLAVAADDLEAYLHSTWDVVPDLTGRIEAVHRLSNFGVVITEVMTGTSQEGFAAEWREIGLFAFEGDLTCRVEVFDEADLDAALARFDELERAASS